MSTTMKGFVVKGDTASLEEMPVPTPKPGACLVRVLIAGICNTDLEIMKGYMGFAGIVGHEFVGVVESAPPGHEALVGKRVVGEINLICRDTANCKTCAFGFDSYNRDEGECARACVAPLGYQKPGTIATCVHGVSGVREGPQG